MEKRFTESLFLSSTSRHVSISSNKEIDLAACCASYDEKIQ